MSDQATLDYHARQLGFPDYQTWLAYQQKQQIGLGGQRAAPAAPVQQAPAQQPTNILQYIMSRIHPGFSTISKSGEAYRRAQGGGQ